MFDDMFGWQVCFWFSRLSPRSSPIFNLFFIFHFFISLP